jgi:hypothetical protein
VDTEAFTSHNDELPPLENAYFTLRTVGTVIALFACAMASATAATFSQLAVGQVVGLCLAAGMAVTYACTSRLPRRGKLWLGAVYFAAFTGFVFSCWFICWAQMGNRHFHESGKWAPPEVITGPFELFALVGCLFFGYAATRLANIVV